MSNNKVKNNLLFLIGGAALGAAATYYVSTPAGKKMIEKAKTNTQMFGKKVANSAQDIAEQTINKSNELLNKANEHISVAQDILTSNAVSILDVAENKVNSFQKGINKAKNNIANHTS